MSAPVVRSARVLLAVWVLLSLAATYRVAHLGVFMLDAEKSSYAISPPVRELTDPDLSKPFFEKHNCFTCYVIAAHLAAEGTENIYLSKHYRNPERETPVHAVIGDTLTIDRYQYPPPFLLLPRLLSAGGHDFFAVRSCWFALSIIAFCVTAVALIVWTFGTRFGAAWWAVPVVLVAPVTLSTLQIGNVHFLIIASAMLGMLALERGHHVLGGALLGYAIVAKLFPGVLLVYLLCRRRWRSVIWTGVAMCAFTLATVVVFGPQPFAAFISYQAPRLASGDAFAFAREAIRPMLVNASIVGATFKIAHVGLLGGLDPLSASRVVTWVYSGLLIVVLAFAALRHRKMLSFAPAEALSPPVRASVVRVWLALLVLAQLRSPFLPWAYGNVAVVWLLAMLLCTGGSFWRIAAIIVVLALLSVNLPLPLGPATGSFDMVYTLGGLVVTTALCLFVVIRDSDPGNVPLRQSIAPDGEVGHGKI